MLLKLWDSLLLLALAFNCFASARRIVEGTQPLTPNLNETARKVASQSPTTQCLQKPNIIILYSNKIKRPEDGGRGGGEVRDF